MSKRVLVTGASSGIGLATAIELARAGFDVVGSVRSPDKGADLERAAKTAGCEVETMVLDLRDPDARSAVGDLDLFGLVNNAGYMNVGRVQDVSIESARQQFEVMLLAPMHLAQLVLPKMSASGEGRIVNVSSLYGRATTPLTGWYQSTKHALDGVADALRIEVGGSGVHVITIEAGGHDTNIWTKGEHDLERRLHNAPDVYERALQILRTFRPFAADPRRVAGAIRRALTDGSPKRRYRVGLDATVLHALDVATPPAVRDAVTRAVLRL